MNWFRRFLAIIPAWASCIAIVLSICSFWIAKGTLDLALSEFRLKYYTELRFAPVALVPHFEVEGEDEGQVWTTIILRANNGGTVKARNVDFQYKIGGPCRGYFTNKNIEEYTKTKIAPFDLPAGEDKYFKITFTDARHCVRDYLANKNYIEVEVTARCLGVREGKEIMFNPSFNFRTMGERFVELR